MVVGMSLFVTVSKKYFSALKMRINSCAKKLPIYLIKLLLFFCLIFGVSSLLLPLIALFIAIAICLPLLIAITYKTKKEQQLLLLQ